MRILIKEKLSENKYKTPEGYLVCVDAILARTGKQQYRKNEIFLDSDDDSIIDVDRPEEEVFNEKTITSFENKPFVNEHPDEDVNVHNHRDYAVGFVRDVHRGKVDGKDVLLGNIIVTDEETIAEIESGKKKELSCGYDCDIKDEENPCQRNIRGNHVALCKAGRAGIARIQDAVEDAGTTRRMFRESEVGDENSWFGTTDWGTPKGNMYIYKKNGKVIAEGSYDGWHQALQKGEKKEFNSVKELNKWLNTPIEDSIEDSEYNIKKVDGHYEIVKNGKTYESADTFKEAEQRLEELENKEEDYIVSYVNSADKTSSIKIKAKNENEAIKKAKSKIGREIYKINSVYKDSIDDSESVEDSEYIISLSENKNASEIKKVAQNLGFDVEETKYELILRGGNASMYNKLKHTVKIVDSVEDKLIAVDERYINELKRDIQKMGFKVVSVKKYSGGEVHFQILSNEGDMDKNDLKYYAEQLNTIDDKFGRYKIPMTYNIGLQYDGYISAGIDLRQQYVKDSVEDSKQYSITYEVRQPGKSPFKETVEFSALEQFDKYLANNQIGTDYALIHSIVSKNGLNYKGNPTKWTEARQQVYKQILRLDSVEDDMELSAKTSEELDNLMKQYQKKHPTWKFGEIRKDKGLYRCSVVKDSVEDSMFAYKGYTIEELIKTKDKSKVYQFETKDGDVLTFKSLEEAKSHIDKIFMKDSTDFIDLINIVKQVDKINKVKDSNLVQSKLKDSDKLKQLIIEFSKLAKYSREYSRFTYVNELTKETNLELDKKLNELYKIALSVYSELKNEIEKESKIDNNSKLYFNKNSEELYKLLSMAIGDAKVAIFMKDNSKMSLILKKLEASAKEYRKVSMKSRDEKTITDSIKDSDKLRQISLKLLQLYSKIETVKEISQRLEGQAQKSNSVLTEFTDLSEQFYNQLKREVDYLNNITKVNYSNRNFKMSFAHEMSEILRKAGDCIRDVYLWFEISKLKNIYNDAQKLINNYNKIAYKLN